MLIKLIFLFILLWGIFQDANAGGPATTGAAIFKKGIGAKPLGMGDAYSAAADDINSIFHNPAGLGNITKQKIGAMYLSGLSDEYYASLSYVRPLLKESAIGISLLTLQGGDIEINYADGTSKTLKAQQDYVVVFSYGGKTETFSYTGEKGFTYNYGANLKLLSSTLVEESKATALSIDMGGILQWKKLRTALVVENLGTKITYKEGIATGDEGDPQPLTFKLGLAYKDAKLTIAADTVKQIDDNIRQNLGVEYLIQDIIAVRLGYKFGFDIASLTAGVGLNIKGYQFDYGIGLMGDFDYTQRLSFTVGF